LPGVTGEREQKPAGGNEVRLEASGGEARFSGGDVTLRIDYVLDGFRLGVFSVVLSLALTMLFGVQTLAGWWGGAAAALGSIGALAIVFRSRRARNVIARAVDWVVGRPR
jgi:hypothetical protein